MESKWCLTIESDMYSLVEMLFGQNWDINRCYARMVSGSDDVTASWVSVYWSAILKGWWISYVKKIDLCFGNGCLELTMYHYE